MSETRLTRLNLWLERLESLGMRDPDTHKTLPPTHTKTLRQIEWIKEEIDIELEEYEALDTHKPHEKFAQPPQIPVEISRTKIYYR